MQCIGVNRSLPKVLEVEFRFAFLTFKFHDCCWISFSIPNFQMKLKLKRRICKTIRNFQKLYTYPQIYMWKSGKLLIFILLTAHRSEERYRYLQMRFFSGCSHHVQTWRWSVIGRKHWWLNFEKIWLLGKLNITSSVNTILKKIINLESLRKVIRVGSSDSICYH